MYEIGEIEGGNQKDCYYYEGWGEEGREGGREGGKEGGSYKERETEKTSQQ